MKIEDNETYRQVREMLTLARDLYCKMADFYDKHKASVKDERVSILVNYLQRHEGQMQAVLSETLAATSQNVLDTYYQFQPEEISVLAELERWRLDPQADLDEIIATAMRFDLIFRNFYVRGADMAPTEAVAEIFRALQRREEVKRNNEVRALLAVKDL